MRLKIVLAVGLILCCVMGMASFSGVQEKRDFYLEVADRLLKMGMREMGAMRYLEGITAVGPRLTGSAEAASAVELTRQYMQDLGLDNIHLEPTRVRRWIRGTYADARIVSSRYGTTPLSIASIGGSVGTSEEGISGKVIEVRSIEELESLGGAAQGRIVFFNRPMDPTLLQTFTAYGQAADQRVQGASAAAKAGGIAALVRSLTTSMDDFPHTGMMQYETGIPKVPAVCVSTKGAEILSRMLKQDPSLRITIRTDSHELSPVISYNVVGDIRGSQKPEVVVLVGGHLDSWDLGTGAHDDGAGCVHSLEALRLIKNLGLKPKRTIRAVMFMDEEFGGTGGRDYARSELRKMEKHIAAIESDRGGFLPLGFGIGTKETFPKYKRWEYMFKHIGMFWLRPGGGGVDIGPLAKGGTLLVGLIPDSQRYFDVHHSGRDVLESVNRRELELGAIAMALLAYVLAEEGTVD